MMKIFEFKNKQVEYPPQQALFQKKLKKDDKMIIFINIIDDKT